MDKNCQECGFVLDQDEQEADILVCHKCGLGWGKKDFDNEWEKGNESV